MSLTQASRDLLSKEPPGVVNAVRAVPRPRAEIIESGAVLCGQLLRRQWTKRRLERGGLVLRI